MGTGTVAVVGSGSAGLGAGFRLRERGFDVRMFEARNYVGGRMKSLYRDGFVIEEGAIWIPEGYTSLLGVIRDAGLGDQLLPSGTVFAFPRDGTLRFMDCSRPLRSGLRFDLLSMRSKVRILALIRDCLRYRRALGGGDLSELAEIDDEDCASYSLRRLNQEILDYVVTPTLGAIAGDVPEKLSKLDLLYSFNTFLAGTAAFGYRGGMSAYTTAIAGLFDVQLEACVTSVEDHADGVGLTWSDSSGIEHHEYFDGCVIATPPASAAAIHRGLDADRSSFLREVPTVPSVNLTVAMSTAPRDMPAIYIPIPDVVDPGLMIIGLTHNLCDGRAPAGKGLASIYTTPVLSRELYDAPDDVCVKRILDAVDRAVPGLIKDIEFTHINRWDPLLMVSRPGYYRDLRRFTDISRRDDTRIQLAGDYFSVSSMNTACASGERAAAHLRTSREAANMKG